MFRLLGRYVFREVLTSALLGTGLATCVIFLQKVDKLFEVLVGTGSAHAGSVLSLFLWALPPVLPLTIPFGVLVGILIGLSRMSADGEITAMRAAGVSSRKVLLPVLLFAALGAGLSAWASLRLTPLAIRESTRIVNELAQNQLSAEVEPRVFLEDFPNTIVYVGDVRPGPIWHHVFIADVSSPDERKSGIQSKADGPLITVSRLAIPFSDAVNNRMRLSLRDYSTHEMGKDAVAHDATAPRGEQALYARPPAQKALPSSAMNTRQLIRYAGPDQLEARIELHRRFALPVACLMLAMVGIPLGLATRKGGRSAGYVNAVFLSFFCYYLALITLIGLAKQRALPVPVAVWLPDVAFGLAGVFFLTRQEIPGDRDLLAGVRETLGSLIDRIKKRLAPAGESHFPGWRLRLLPQLVDTYILSGFVFYVAVVLGSFVSMTLVYNFFELTGDMVRNKIPLSRVAEYLLFLTPKLVYDILPISILVGVLVAFGLMSKQNEVTAFKACGVSLHRLALPVFLVSMLFSAGLFAFDYYYVPGANRRQDALRDEIKGRPKQTYLRADRKWIMGYDSRIYYYRYFDTTEKTMADVNVLELDPDTFRLKRQILAKRARWSPAVGTWVLENGWKSDFDGTERISYQAFDATSFRELTEPPDYFLKEAVQDKQMNFRQLGSYIADLKQSGFDTVKLQVRLHRKFSVPLFAFIMALLAVPFAFMVGQRGAMTGVAVSLGIAICYWGTGMLFEKLGDVSQLPPAMAAWGPDAIFALAGCYLLLRVR